MDSLASPTSCLTCLLICSDTRLKKRKKKKRTWYPWRISSVTIWFKWDNLQIIYNVRREKKQKKKLTNISITLRAAPDQQLWFQHKNYCQRWVGRSCSSDWNHNNSSHRSYTKPLVQYIDILIQTLVLYSSVKVHKCQSQHSVEQWQPVIVCTAHTSALQPCGEQSES